MTTSELEQLPDDALIRLFQTRRPGDDRAFSALFRRHHHSVWRLCYRFVYQTGDVEDLVQDVFLRVYRGLDKFEGRSSFTTWLYRVVLSTGQNEIRSRRRRPQADGTELDDLADRLTDGTSAESALIGLLPAEDLARALESLSPDALGVICLRDVEGLPYTEIAERLDIGVSAAKMRVQRARLALQQAYDEANRQSKTKSETRDHHTQGPVRVGQALPGRLL